MAGIRWALFISSSAYGRRSALTVCIMGIIMPCKDRLALVSTGSKTLAAFAEIDPFSCDLPETQPWKISLSISLTLMGFAASKGKCNGKKIAVRKHRGPLEGFSQNLENELSL